MRIYEDALEMLASLKFVGPRDVYEGRFGEGGLGGVEEREEMESKDASTIASPHYQDKPNIQEELIEELDCKIILDGVKQLDEPVDEIPPETLRGNSQVESTKIVSARRVITSQSSKGMTADPKLPDISHDGMPAIVTEED